MKVSSISSHYSHNYKKINTIGITSFGKKSPYAEKRKAILNEMANHHSPKSEYYLAIKKEISDILRKQLQNDPLTKEERIELKHNKKWIDTDIKNHKHKKYN